MKPQVRLHTAPTLQNYYRSAGECGDSDSSLSERIENLLFERYVDCSGWRSWAQQSWLWDAYYRMRPRIPDVLRRQLQRIYLRDWNSIPFPSWPIDRTADILLEEALSNQIRELGLQSVPFIWFWPNGHKACAIVTHDVETTEGRDFSERLMDFDDACDIKASFQIVPEKRYAVPPDYLQTIRDRGFEINVQGLDHDGNLFRNRREFLLKAARINDYAVQFGARGFRSPVLYRKSDWFQDLVFSYDMSTPNVARLEAQRGGCCTLMPYFLPGDVLELPLTLTEDYTLFHILQDYSLTLWKRQLETIVASHGLITVLAHPDYLIENRAQAAYRALLDEIARLRSDEDVWVTLPGEVDRWWRARAAMRLIRKADTYQIEGPESARARVAYATLENGRLIYDIDGDRVGAAFSSRPGSQCAR
ncbi:MAG TPA: hypothetical protein VFY29_01670 [Terriglobia bacterium]|nr:hypothetical protein [Terriglobia bacterium]